MLWVAAPEPEDVNWDKFGQRPCERVFRTLVATTITVGALAGSFIILLGSSKFELYVKGNNAENKDGPIINFLISILLSTPIYLTNFLLTSNYFSNQHCWSTSPETGRNTRPTPMSKSAWAERHFWSCSSTRLPFQF
jgi:hypothetical protein